MAMWTETTRQAIRLGTAASTWSAALVLTVVGTLRPALAERLVLWIVLAVGVAVTATLAAVINRAQWEVVEDMRAEAQNGVSRIKPCQPR